MQAPAVGPPAPTLFDAIMELLDFPHPLDMLSEVTAYGPDGAISRYHNPANYTRALGGVLRSRRKAWRPLLGGPSLVDALGQQQGAASSGASPGMAASGLWFNPRTGTQKVCSAGKGTPACISAVLPAWCACLPPSGVTQTSSGWRLRS